MDYLILMMIGLGYGLYIGYRNSLEEDEYKKTPEYWREKQMYPLGHFPQRFGHNIRRSQERRAARQQRAQMNRIYKQDLKNKLPYTIVKPK